MQYLLCYLLIFYVLLNFENTRFLTNFIIDLFMPYIFLLLILLRSLENFQYKIQGVYLFIIQLNI